MSKERLEEIEREIERSNNATLKGNSLGAERMILDLHEIGRFEWLVKHAKEQAERVQELEKFKRDVEQMYRYIHLNAKKSVEEKENLQKQNKRYREALEFYADEKNYDYKINTDSVGDMHDMSYMEIHDVESKIMYDYGEKATKALDDNE